MKIKLLIYLILIFILTSCSSSETLLKNRQYAEYIKECKAESDEALKRYCYHKLADSYYNNENFQVARKYYSKQYSNDYKMYAKASLNLANIMYKKNKIDEFIKLCEEIDMANDAYLRVGNLYLSKKQYSLAAWYYQKIPDSKKIKKIAEIYFNKGLYARAEFFYKKINILKNKLWFLANKYSNKKNYFKSSLYYEKVGNSSKSQKEYKKLGKYYQNDEFQKQFNSSITSIISTGDFIYFSTLNGNIFKLDIEKKEVEKILSLKNKVFQIVFNSHMYSLVIRSKNKITILNLDNNEKKYIYKRASVVKVTPNGEYLAYAEKNGRINIIKFKNLELINYIDTNSGIITDIILTNDIVISTGVDDRLIKFYSINSKGELYNLKGHYQEIIKLLINPDENILISIGKDEKIVVWDLEKQRKKIMFTSAIPILDFTVSKDFTKIITSNYRGLEIWDFGAKKIKSISTENPITSLFSLEDGYNLLVGDKSGTIKIIKPQKNIAIEQAFSKANLDDTSLINLGDKAFENKNYDQMIKYYELASKSNIAYLKIADYFFKVENYDNAIKYYMLINNKTLEVNSKIAESYFKLGEYEQAYKFFLIAKNNPGIIKTAKMYNYEGNYYKSLTLYITLASIFNKNKEIEREKAMYYKIAELFTTMDDVKDYKGKVSSLEEKKQIEEQLNKWFKNKYLLAEKYFEKAEQKEKGFIFIANHSCNDNNFELAIEYYERIKNDIDKKNCINKAGDFYFEKVKNSYNNIKDKKFKKEDKKKELKNIKNNLSKSKSYYNMLRNRKMIRKINKIKKAINKL